MDSWIEERCEAALIAAREEKPVDRLWIQRGMLPSKKSGDADPALPKQDAELPAPQEKNGRGHEVVDALKVHVESETGDEPVDPQGSQMVARAQPRPG